MINYYGALLIAVVTVATTTAFAQEVPPVPGRTLFTNDIALSTTDSTTIENYSRFRCYEFPLYCVYKRNKESTQYLMNMVLRTVFGRDLLDPVTEFYIDPEYGPDELIFAYYKNAGGPLAPADPADLLVMERIKQVLVRHDRNEQIGPNPEQMRVTVQVVAIEESQARDFNFSLSNLIFGIVSGDDDSTSRKSVQGNTWSLGMNTAAVTAELDWRNKAGISKVVDTYRFVIENGQRLSSSRQTPTFREFNSGVADPEEQFVGMKVSGRARYFESDGVVRFEGLHFDVGFLVDEENSTVENIETQNSSLRMTPGETYLFYDQTRTFDFKSRGLGLFNFGRESRESEAQVMLLVSVDVLSPGATSMEVDRDDQGLTQILSDEEVNQLPVADNPALARKQVLASFVPVISYEGTELFYTFVLDKHRQYLAQNILKDEVQVEAWVDVDARADKEDWKYWLPKRVRTIEELVTKPDIALASSTLPDDVYDQDILEENLYPVRFSFCPLTVNGSCNSVEQIVLELRLNPKRAFNGFYLVR